MTLTASCRETPASVMKEKVLEIILQHRGWENAIKGAELALQVGTNTRELQHIIRDLRREGKPILSTCRAPYGYYMPESWAEVSECLDSLKSRLIEDAKTRRDIKRAAAEYFSEAARVRLL